MAGYAIRRAKLFPDNAAATLNQFVIYISLPAMVLLEIPKLAISMDLFIPVIIAWSVMAASAVLVLLASRFLGYTKEITGALMLVAVLGNSSFLGIPIIEAYMGSEALGYVIAYDQLGTFLALATYGTFVASYYSHKSEMDAKMIIKKIITFPPFVSLVIALLLSGISFAAPVEHVLSILAQTIVPLALVAVGLQLQFKLPQEQLGAFSTALVIKLILSPLIAIIIALAFGWQGLSTDVSLMEAGMAPMITAAAVASLVGLAPALTAAIVGYGIIISIMTTALLFQIINLL